MAGMKERIREESMKFGMKAMSKLMEDPERAEKVISAVQKVQTGRAQLDETTAKLRNLADLPSREDFKAMGKRVGKMRREMRKLTHQLEGILEAL